MGAEKGEGTLEAGSEVVDLAGEGPALGLQLDGAGPAGIQHSPLRGALAQEPCPQPSQAQGKPTSRA